MSGTGRFLLVYFVGGLVGAMAHAVMTTAMNNPTVLVGASGAVAGCAGYYSLRYMQVRVPVAGSGDGASARKESGRQAAGR